MVFGSFAQHAKCTIILVSATILTPLSWTSNHLQHHHFDTIASRTLPPLPTHLANRWCVPPSPTLSAIHHGPGRPISVCISSRWISTNPTTPRWPLFLATLPAEARAPPAMHSLPFPAASVATSLHCYPCKPTKQKSLGLERFPTTVVSALLIWIVAKQVPATSGSLFTSTRSSGESTGSVALQNSDRRVFQDPFGLESTPRPRRQAGVACQACRTSDRSHSKRRNRRKP